MHLAVIVNELEGLLVVYDSFCILAHHILRVREMIKRSRVIFVQSHGFGEHAYRLSILTLEAEHVSKFD